jgi:DNA-binding Lrp family transcriptional regulator
MELVTEGDLELVDALQINPTASWTKIGAILGISALTAARRWRKLEEAGIAWTGATMGPELFRGAFVELACHPGTVDAVIAVLNEMPDVITVGRTVGDFDLYVITVAPTVAALTALLWQRLDTLDVARRRAHVYPLVYGGPNWRLTVLNRGQTNEIREPGSGLLPSTTSTVEADRQLFLALAQDARRAYIDLADEFGSTPHAVRRQVQRMRRRGHLAFRADIARPLAGWPVAALLRLSVPDEDVDEVGRDLGGWPETRFCAPLVAAANLVLVVNLRAPEQAGQMIAQLRARHPAVRVVDRSLVLRLAKVHGRILDDRGRSIRMVPVNPWGADE